MVSWPFAAVGDEAFALFRGREIKLMDHAQILAIGGLGARRAPRLRSGLGIRENRAETPVG